MLGSDVSCGRLSENALMGVLPSWHRRWLRDAGRQNPQVGQKTSLTSITRFMILIILIMIVLIIISIHRRHGLQTWRTCERGPRWTHRECPKESLCQRPLHLATREIGKKRPKSRALNLVLASPRTRKKRGKMMIRKDDHDDVHESKILLAMMMMMMMMGMMRRMMRTFTIMLVMMALVMIWGAPQRHVLTIVDM